MAEALADGGQHGLDGLAAGCGGGGEEVELDGGGRGLEAGDADAGEAEAAAVGLDGGEQATGGAVDLAVVVGGVREGALTGLGDESVVADLEVDRAGAQVLGDEAVGDAGGLGQEVAVEGVGAGDVVLVGVLVADRLRGAVGDDGALVDRVAEAVEVAAVVAEPAGEGDLAEVAEVGDRADAALGEALLGARADAPERADRQGGRGTRARCPRGSR